jgi:hypothetical protein
MSSFEKKVLKNLNEVFEHPHFQALTNDLASMAGYLPGQNIYDFKNDIFLVVLKHSFKEKK